MKPKKIIIDNIEIIVTKKKVKNFNLKVYLEENKIRLSAPKWVSDTKIKDFLLMKLPWIKKQQLKISNKPKIRYLTGEKHLLFGKEYTLNVKQSNINNANIIDNRYIELLVKDTNDFELKEKTIYEWYRAKLKYSLPNIIKKWEDITGLKINEYKIRKMKTRWGTCNINKKRIWLNLELAKKSKRCIEYIILHELIHLLERYHNDNFKKYMTKYMPNWKEIDYDELRIK